MLVTSFEYTRPIALTGDLSAIGGRAKRTSIETYDPSLDQLAIDLHVRAKAPLRIKNNLVEMNFAIDTGTLDVSGTDQRLGLRGDLRALPGGRFHFRANDFDIKQAIVRFEDPTRIAPSVDVLAVTEYRRFDTTSGAAAGASSTTSATTGVTTTSTGGAAGGVWRISLHAYGDADNVKLDMTSDPALSQDDIALLLTIGITRAEADQLSLIGASGALRWPRARGARDGERRRPCGQGVDPGHRRLPLRQRVLSAFGTHRPDGHRRQACITDDVRASVTTGLTEDREIRSNIEWRLNQRMSVQGSYDNINDVSSSTVGNLGADLRWRLEFE